MDTAVRVCGAVRDRVSGELAGRTGIAVRDGIIVEIGRSVAGPDGAETIDLTERTVSSGFIDTHVLETMDAATLARQTLESSAANAMRGGLSGGQSAVSEPDDEQRRDWHAVRAVAVVDQLGRVGLRSPARDMVACPRAETGQ